MKMSVYTGTDFIFETRSDKVSYPKGSFIQLEVDKSDDVYVVNHRISTIQELSDPKDPQSKKVSKQVVEAKYLKFTRMEDLRFATENLVLEDQLSEFIDLKEISLSDILLKERVSPDQITSYLSNKSTSLEKSYIKDGITHIRLPVRRLVKDSTLNEKLKTFSKFDRIDPPTSDGINTISIREKNKVKDTRNMVVSEALYGEIDSKLLGYLQNKLTESCPKDWKIRQVENSVRVSINGERPAALNTILETFPIRLKKTLGLRDYDTFYELKIRGPEPEKVVESFYTKYTPYKLAEDISDKKEGDPCMGEDGKQGILYKMGDGFVCMVEESYLNDLDLDEVFFEGDSCGPNGIGRLKLVEGKMCCVVDNKTYTHHYTDFKTFKEESNEGDACEKDGKKGKLVRDGDSLVCKIEESREEILFTCLKEQDDAGMDSGGVYLPADPVPLDGVVPTTGKEPGPDPSTNPEAGPREGDPCDDHGQPGVLMMVNGALICSCGAGLPAGASGAN